MKHYGLLLALTIMLAAILGICWITAARGEDPKKEYDAAWEYPFTVPQGQCLPLPGTQPVDQWVPCVVYDLQHEAATRCLAKMDAAMRAMDPYIPSFVDPVTRRKAARGPLNYWGDLLCQGSWCGGIEYHDSRSIEERLEEDRRRYEREQEELGRQIVEDQRERWAYQQWATVKRECWRQP